MLEIITDGTTAWNCWNHFLGRDSKIETYQEVGNCFNAHYISLNGSKELCLAKQFTNSFLRTEMKKQQLDSASLTVLDMWRSYLLTKEKMKNYYKREFQNQNTSFKGPSKCHSVWKKSVHEDLDCFFKNIRLGRLQENRIVTHFLPKLTKIELRLVAMKDYGHLKAGDLQNYLFLHILNGYWSLAKTYSWFETDKNPDVAPTEMKESKSKSNFVRGVCFRQTMILNPWVLWRKQWKILKFSSCFCAYLLKAIWNVLQLG